MKRYELSRNEAKKVSIGSGKDIGGLFEEIVAYEYTTFGRDFRDVDYYDLVGSSEDDTSDPDTVAQVKAVAHKWHLKGDTEPGRWRLWRTQHEQLVEHDRRDDGSAWYVFAVYNTDVNPPTVRMVRKKPAAVGRSIGARGGWHPSGHPMGDEYKLPTDAVFG